MNAFTKTRQIAIACSLLCLAGALGLACARQPAEVELHAETREGMFYLSLTEAREVALREGKHVLVDFWRPG